MESAIRALLLLSAALYMGWGLALVLAPEITHTLISYGPYDPATTAMFGAALIGMMVMFVIAAYDPEREIVRASVAGLAVVGFTAAYLVFVANVMPLRPVTVLSLVYDLAACGALFLLEARLDLRKQTRAKRAAGGRQRHARA